MKKLYIAIFSILLFGLAGCAKVTPISKEITMELGQGLSEDPAQFVNVADEAMLKDVVMDFSEIDFAKAGDYTANAVYEGRKYPIAIHIQDTVAPECELSVAYLIVQPDTEISVIDLFSSIKDEGETTAGFLMSERTGDLEVVTDEELENMGFPEGQVQILEDEGEFSEKMTFTEEGIYRVQAVVKDASQNAVVYTLPVYVDGTAPEIITPEDELITINNIEGEFEASVDGLNCIDNLDGDFTEHKRKVIIEMYPDEVQGDERGDKYIAKATATDRAGNSSESQWNIYVKNEYDYNAFLANIMGMGAGASVSEGYHPELARQLFDLTNQERTANGLHELVWDDTLESTANVRAPEITVVFSHTRPDGSDIWSLADIYTLNGENCARYGNGPKDIHESLLTSPSHRANILEPRFTRGGYSYYVKDGKPYVVQHFGI